MILILSTEVNVAIYPGQTKHGVDPNNKMSELDLLTKTKPILEDDCLRVTKRLPGDEYWLLSFEEQS